MKTQEEKIKELIIDTIVLGIEIRWHDHTKQGSMGKYDPDCIGVDVNWPEDEILVRLTKGIEAYKQSVNIGHDKRPGTRYAKYYNDRTKKTTKQ